MGCRAAGPKGCTRSVTAAVWTVAVLTWAVIAAMWAAKIPMCAVVAAWAPKGLFGPAWKKSFNGRTIM